MRARDRLPGHRRHEVLRARRDQGRDRLPHVPRQPAATRSRSRGSPTRRGAGSARRRCRACSRTPTRSGCTVWDAAADPRRACRGSAPRRSRRCERFMTTMDAAARARGRRRRAGRRPARGAARRDRLPRGAGGRADDRGAGPDREPRGARARWRASSTRRADAEDRARRRSCSRSRWSPTPTRRGRRGPRDADDAAQRQGPRVPDRLHHRLRGRRLPALARARRGRRSRRSGASATSASRARCATCTLTYARRRNVFGAQSLRAAEPLPRRDARRPHRPPGRAQRVRGGRGRTARSAHGRASWAATAQPTAPRRVGHGLPASATTSSHAAFGEGVVTGGRAGRDRRRALRRRRLASAS